MFLGVGEVTIWLKVSRHLHLHAGASELWKSAVISTDEKWRDGLEPLGC